MNGGGEDEKERRRNDYKKAGKVSITRRTWSHRAGESKQTGFFKKQRPGLKGKEGSQFKTKKTYSSTRR